MNLLLFDAEEVSAARVTLPAADRRAEHIVRVLRAGVGDVLRAGIVCGAHGSATVRALSAAGVTLELALEAQAPPPPARRLALALPRPKALTRVLAAAASFGLRQIALLNAWRVDKSYWSSPRLEPASVDAALREGCEQGQTTWLPAVRRERLLMPYLEGLAAAPVEGLRLLADPRGESIEQVARAELARGALVAIGPEGGWIEDELGAFERAGFVAVSLGRPTLRSHDAVVAALAQLSLLERL
ncbi:MAG: 16S rRNA (uracil(1498)-N(3))-methyltransferase [Myxococcales bacterium]|nr:16S rRNA (uracil(1498)-N(3))-methyltransferase [Myxococcales bacterium]